MLQKLAISEKTGDGAQKGDLVQTGIMECQQERWECITVVFSVQGQGEVVMLEMREGQEELQATH